MEPDRARWPDRMGPIDTLAWVLSRAGCEPPALGLLLHFDGAVNVAALEESLWTLCDRSTRLRQRVVEVPFDLAPPEWVEDERFEIGRQFQQKSAREASTPDLLRTVRADLRERLGDDRPLWRAVLYNRLPHDRSAVLLRMHPCSTDGLGLSRLLAKVYGVDLPVDPSTGGFSRTPRLTTADALLWRALQFNWDDFSWDDLSDLLASAPPALRPASSADLRALLSGSVDVRWLANLGSGLLGQSLGSPTARARRRSRRLSICEIEARAIDRARERLGCGADTLLAHVVARALARSRQESRLAPLPTEVWLPVQRGSGEGPAVVAESIDGGQAFDEPTLRRFERRLRPRAVARRRAQYRLLARAALALPAQAIRAAWTAWSRQRDTVHLTLAGAGRATRFAGCEVRTVVPWVAAADETPISVALHRYRGRYSMGFDVDPHTAPPAGEIEAALFATVDELANVRRQRRLR